MAHNNTHREIAERFLKEELELRERITSNEYGAITTEWVLNNKDPVLLALIEARMVEILEFHLRDITDYGELLFLREHSSPDSTARKQVETRMFEVNEIQYCERTQNLDRATTRNEEKGTFYEIEDFNVLMERWMHSTPDSELQEQIEILIVYSNCMCDDYHQLILRLKQTGRNTMPNKLVTSRMRELNVACGDDDELYRRREISLHNYMSPCLVDERILQLREERINCISDYPRLVEQRKMYGNGSTSEKLIEARMFTVNKTQLPEITNYQDLLWRRENATPDSLLQKQIEARMKELLDAVDPHNVPWWVIERLQSPNCFERHRPEMYIGLSRIAKQIITLG